ncbi:hypothetical protein AB205_0205120 [Aquarana catesbeiana]|uniref:Uncharacterized protein n=1 Tax=Aquarana catesbeiana TaxID=8400 RepID=A0A2G9RIH0_AQUCT|nr:hypothetical protein AB205_0205120 [Aquarana catesbeiana]
MNYHGAPQHRCSSLKTTSDSCKGCRNLVVFHSQETVNDLSESPLLGHHSDTASHDKIKFKASFTQESYSVNPHEGCVCQHGDAQVFCTFLFRQSCSCQFGRSLCMETAAPFLTVVYKFAFLILDVDVLTEWAAFFILVIFNKKTEFNIVANSS